MKNTLLFVIASAVLIYGAWWQYQLVQNMQPVETPEATQASPANVPLQETPPATTDHEDPELQSLLDEEKKSLQETEQLLALADKADLDPPLPATQSAPLWQALPEEGTRDHSLPVSLNRDAITALSPGDPLQLPAINGQSLSGTVTGKSISASGNLTLKGQLQAWSETYPVIITQGKKHTFATIATPDGIYELQARGEQGTLLSSVSFNRLIDPTKSDVIAPPANTP